MLRATSEMAVAIKVRSVLEKPSSVDSLRPSWRAVTMSSSRAIGTRISSANAVLLPRDAVEKCEPLLEVECGVHAFEVESQLHHRERDFGLDSHHHSLRPA